MAIFQATRKYLVVLLALVAFNGTLLIQGRQIKPLNQHFSLKKGTLVQEYNPVTPLKPTTNVHTPSSEKKKVDSSVTPSKQGVESFGDSSDTNAFRPTTPGNSPGVGHHAQENKYMKAKIVVHSPEVKVYVTEGTPNGFKPTDPGHSPGVGHSQQNKIGQ